MPSTKNKATDVKSKTKTVSCPTSEMTATQIAECVIAATTPGQKAAATRRMKMYVSNRVAAGADGSRVEQTLKNMCKRLGRG